MTFPDGSKKLVLKQSGQLLGGLPSQKLAAGDLGTGRLHDVRSRFRSALQLLNQTGQSLVRLFRQWS